MIAREKLPLQEIGYRLTLGVTCDGLVSYQGGGDDSLICLALRKLGISTGLMHLHGT